METLVLIIHVVLAVALIALILLQQGKGADAGASFGAGASQTVFGGKGSSSFLVKLTAAFAAILLVTSIALGIMTKHKAERQETGGFDSAPVQKTVPSPSTVPSTSDVPQVQQKKSVPKTASDVLESKVKRATGTSDAKSGTDKK